MDSPMMETQQQMRAAAGGGAKKNQLSHVDEEEVMKKIMEWNAFSRSTTRATFLRSVPCWNHQTLYTQCTGVLFSIPPARKSGQILQLGKS